MLHQLPPSPRAQGALADLVKAGACPYELLDLLQQRSALAKRRAGFRRPHRRRPSWSLERVRTLANELLRVAAQLADLRDEANRRSIRGFHNDVPTDLVAEAERLSCIAPLIDGRSTVVDPLDLIQDHIVEKTGQPHYLTLAGLVGDDGAILGRLARALEQRRRRRLDRKRLSKARRIAVARGDPPVSMESLVQEEPARRTGLPRRRTGPPRAGE